MLFLTKVLLIITSFLGLSHCLKPISIQKPYDKGVKAYTGERWSECITQLEEVLRLYKLYKSVIINCRIKCNNNNLDSKVKENIDDLKIYEVFFNRKECLTNCKNKNFEDLQISSEVDELLLSKLQSRKPYEYLHMCYFQMNALPRAASAAFTFLVANPDDSTMQNNLKYYIEQPEVDKNEVVDLLSDDYVGLYRLGLREYSKGNWADTIANMEEVIIDYIHSEYNCRVECEQQPEQEWSPEIYITVSNNIAALLHCQQQCQDKLKVLNYDSGLDFLGEILHYIQISYYHLERYNEAVKSVATYLMMFPKDEDMLENQKIYKTLVDEKYFTIRFDVEKYYKRDVYEKELLNLFHGRSNNNVDSNTI